MNNKTMFSDLLEAVDDLSMDEQETLISILQRRIVDRRRAELLKDIKRAQKEFEDNKCKPVSPAEIMKELLS